MMMILMSVTMVMAEPHSNLVEGDSPCLHKPCQHGVCVETNTAERGYQCFCEGRQQQNSDIVYKQLIVSISFQRSI